MSSLRNLGDVRKRKPTLLFSLLSFPIYPFPAPSSPSEFQKRWKIPSCFSLKWVRRRPGRREPSSWTRRNQAEVTSFARMRALKNLPRIQVSIPRPITPLEDEPSNALFHPVCLSYPAARPGLPNGRSLPPRRREVDHLVRVPSLSLLSCGRSKIETKSERQ
jgi:hypothetical protein